MTRDCKAPFWRQVLRGFSQCAFQANEIAGLLFVVAVAVFNWRMPACYVVAVIVGTFVARLLNGIGELLDLGLYGFNSGLIGLALGNSFQPDPMLWVCVVVFAIVAAAATVAMSKWVPIPFLAAPFILTFWLVWPQPGPADGQAEEVVQEVACLAKRDAQVRPTMTGEPARPRTDWSAGQFQVARP